MTKKTISVKEIIFALMIAIILATLDLLIIPASLFGKINVLDIEPTIILLIVNQWFLIVVGLIAIRFLCPNFELGLKKDGLMLGLKRYLPSALIFLAVATFAYYIGLRGRFDYTPTVWKVLVETFLYNISVGFLEELYIKGLLLSIIILLCIKKKNASFFAIIASSVLFSLGHIPGMIGLDAATIVMRLIWTLMLGIYLGVIYKTTGNLWVPIIIHAIINFSGISFCFTTQREFPQISVIIIMITTLIIGAWSIYNYYKHNKQDE